MKSYYYKVENDDGQMFEGTVRASRPSEVFMNDSVPDPIMGTVHTVEIVERMGGRPE